MELVKEIVNWANKTFPCATTVTVTTHLAREVRELIAADTLEERKSEIADCFILLTHHSSLSGYKLYYEFTECLLLEEAVLERIMDAFINFSLAQKYGDQEVIIYNARKLCKSLYDHSVCCKYDIFDEVEKKFEVNKSRTWNPPDDEGVVEHVREL